MRGLLACSMASICACRICQGAYNADAPQLQRETQSAHEYLEPGCTALSARFALTRLCNTSPRSPALGLQHALRALRMRRGRSGALD